MMGKKRIFGMERAQAVLLAGIMAAVLLSSLDTNIVSTAMPAIISQLGGLELFSWVFSAYLITSTVAIMVGGKLGDMYGRRKIYMAGIAVFLVGSALSGLSQDMGMLIVFRGLQGIGGGIMVVSGMAITGEIFPPAERGKWQGMIGAVFAIASIVGPLAGGLITEYASWQWVFYVNIPIGLCAMYLIWKGDYEQHKQKAHARSIDYLGVASFAAFAVLLIFYLVSGTTSQSPAYSAALAVSFACLVVFIWQETRAPEPIMPLGIFANRAFLISATSAFISSGVLNGVVAFLPLFIIGVMGHGVASAGNALAPLLLSFVAASAASGHLITKTGRYRISGIAGCALVMAGMYALSGIHEGTGYWTIVASAAILGLGLGIVSPLFVMLSQNAVEPSEIGTATAAFGFFRNLGCAVIVALMGAMVNLSADKAALAPQAADAQALVSGISGAFFAVFAISAIPLALMLLMEETPLRKSHEKTDALEEAGIEFAEEETAMDSERAKQWVPKR